VKATPVEVKPGQVWVGKTLHQGTTIQQKEVRIGRVFEREKYAQQGTTRKIMVPYVEFEVIQDGIFKPDWGRDTWGGHNPQKGKRVVVRLSSLRSDYRLKEAD